MNYNSREEVKNLMNKFCTEIEDKFRMGGVIEFNYPFTIYVTQLQYCTYPGPPPTNGS